MEFQLKAPFQPTGDQPKAIAKLVQGLKKNYRAQTLLGVTGSGKTFTMAQIINKLQRPALIISHNKTLAAQLASEFKQFFPANAVNYFVSYYDYYQPEAYIPSSDTYIEKETQLNEEIDRLRHAATQSILSRRDTIIVASVSCIYGLGSPIEYARVRINLEINQDWPRLKLLRQLNSLRYERSDIDFHRGTYRVKGDMVDIWPADSLDKYYRLRFSGNKLEKISDTESITGEVITQLAAADIYPASHYVAPAEKFEQALIAIANDLKKETAALLKKNQLIEAQRLTERTKFDLEMLKATGFCNGVENYSRYFEDRTAGKPPYTLVDYFPPDALVFIDESHMTIPQIRAMSAGDKSRKETLVRYGFRLKAAIDNRPLTFAEFNARVNQLIYVSATPSDYEKETSQATAEQLIRPTGLLDPEIEVRPTKYQIDDLVKEVRLRIANKQRVLITTLTKRMSEDLTDYLQDEGLKVQYLHSEVDTFDRLEILRDLRLGKYDVIVGINLLREGLDLPEVSLICILDADKEGYLRSSTALVQTIGRAARHQEGKVIMYADRITKSMKFAIDETTRRRTSQQAYNRLHHITPQTIIKNISEGRLAGSRQIIETIDTLKIDLNKLDKNELAHVISDLKNQMSLASANLEFEKAALLRDQIKDLETKQPKTRKYGRR